MEEKNLQNAYDELMDKYKRAVDEKDEIAQMAERRQGLLAVYFILFYFYILFYNTITLIPSLHIRSVPFFSLSPSLSPSLSLSSSLSSSFSPLFYFRILHAKRESVQGQFAITRGESKGKI